MLLGAAVALFCLWVASLVAMAVYSAKRPPDRIIGPLPSSPHADPQDFDSR
jgi:cation transporter-like permease